MAIGSSKIGVLGGGGVPAGSQTFNASGTFTVPSGVSKVNITGVGGSGNAGNPGNSGNPGHGGGGGGGGGAQFVRNYTVPCPESGPYIAQQALATGSAAGRGGWHPQLGYCSQNTAYTGNSGTAGSPGSAGSAGQSSSGLSKTFTGGNAGGAGNAGTAGSGGGGGTQAFTTITHQGPSWSVHQPKGCGGSIGGGQGGGILAGSGYYDGSCYHRHGGGGGGGAGHCNSGNPAVRTPGFGFQSSGYQGGTAGTTGGGQGGQGGTAFPSLVRANDGGQINTGNNRAGAGGGGGSYITSGGGVGGGGGGGGGRGQLGGSGGTGNPGGAASPASYNCLPVTPGGSYPIVVASGGQVKISWPAQ